MRLNSLRSKTVLLCASASSTVGTSASSPGSEQKGSENSNVHWVFMSVLTPHAVMGRGFSQSVFCSCVFLSWISVTFDSL